MKCEFDSYWFCPECKEELASNRVTYQELCDTCGHQVVWIENQSTADLVQLLRTKKEVYKIANNVLYFDDNSDYKTALWEILSTINLELEEYPKLEYME